MTEFVDYPRRGGGNDNLPSRSREGGGGEVGRAERGEGGGTRIGIYIK